MSKYQKLWIYLKNDGKNHLVLSFSDIKDVLGFPIDHSFLTFKKELLEYGYRVGKISLKEQIVNFHKTEPSE